MGYLQNRMTKQAMTFADLALISGAPAAITAAAIRDGDATDKLKSALATTAGAGAGGFAAAPLLTVLDKAKLLPNNNAGMLASLLVPLTGAAAGGTLGYQLEKNLSDKK